MPSDPASVRGLHAFVQWPPHALPGCRHVSEGLALSADTVRTESPCCPQCGRPLQRVRRLNADRSLRTPAHARRYRCAEAACGWEGLLQVATRRRRPRPVEAPERKTSWWSALLAALRRS